MKSSTIQMTILMALLVMAFAANAQNPSNTLKIQGIGRVAVEDIQGIISASIISNAQSPDEVINANSEKVRVIVSALNSVGINESDIQTSQFSFYPVYTRDQGQNVFDGYGVNNGLSITVKNSSEIGPILDLIIQAGVTRIDGVNFDSVDIDLLQRQALRKATQDAKSKALVLAKASSVTLGRVIQIDNTNPYGIVRAAGSQPSGSTAILPGTNYITSTVTIEYLIE